MPEFLERPLRDFEIIGQMRLPAQIVGVGWSDNPSANYHPVLEVRIRESNGAMHTTRAAHRHVSALMLPYDVHEPRQPTGVRALRTED
jgi:hypothetical protein